MYDGISEAPVRAGPPVLLFASILVTSVAAAPSQRTATESTPTFRIGAKLVELDVVARAKRGPATGLTKDDFTLLDNGKPQDIAVFSIRSVRAAAPPPAPSAPPLPPGIASNRPNPSAEPPATQTILLLDQIFTAPANQAYDIQRIRLFLSQRRKRDGVGVYTVGTRLNVVQDVTADDALLRKAANALAARNGNIRDADTTGMNAHAAAEFEALRLREQIDTLKHSFEAIARHLANVPGRKNLIWITEGFPMMICNQFICVDFKPDIEEAARALNDANVALYSVDARGLIGALGQMTGIANAETGPQRQLPMIMQNRGPVGPSHIDTMNMFATLTGGDVYYNTNGIEDSFEDAIRDGDVTYSLGFYPAEASQDGQTHKLSVKVAKSGITLRYRETYFAVKSQTEAEKRPTAEQLLNDPLDATQIGVLAQATPDPTKPGLFNVRVSADLHDIHLDSQDNKWTAAIELSFFLENSKSAEISTQTIEVPSDQLVTALEKGLVFEHQVELPPQSLGHASVLRIAVEDKATGAAGSLRLRLP